MDAPVRAGGRPAEGSPGFAAQAPLQPLPPLPEDAGHAPGIGERLLMVERGAALGMDLAARQAGYRSG